MSEQLDGRAVVQLHHAVGVHQHQRVADRLEDRAQQPRLVDGLLAPSYDLGGEVGALVTHQREQQHDEHEGGHQAVQQQQPRVVPRGVGAGHGRDGQGGHDRHGPGEAVRRGDPRSEPHAGVDGREQDDPAQRVLAVDEHDAQADRGDHQGEVDVEQPGADGLGAGTAADQDHHAGAGRRRRRRCPARSTRTGRRRGLVTHSPGAGPIGSTTSGADQAGQEQVDQVTGTVRREVVVADPPAVDEQGDAGLHDDGRGHPCRDQRVEAQAGEVTPVTTRTRAAVAGHHQGASSTVRPPPGEGQPEEGHGRNGLDRADPVHL